jgi:hypothetical protein
VGNTIRDKKAKYFGKGIENGEWSLLIGSLLLFGNMDNSYFFPKVKETPLRKAEFEINLRTYM